MQSIICPKCKGEKQVYVRCFPVSLAGWQTCDVCNGNGSIDEEKRAKLEIGNYVKEKRTKLRIPLRKIAEENGLTLSAWSQIEQGKSTLENAYKARSVIEGYKYVEKTEYVVSIWISSSVNFTETFDDKVEAEKLRAEKLTELRSRGLGGYIEIEEKRVVEIISPT